MAKREIMYVEPIAGAMVRTPRTMAVLPIKGGWVPKDNYWLRRIADGSVREALPPEAVIEKEVEQVEQKINTKKEKSKEEANKQ